MQIGKIVGKGDLRQFTLSLEELNSRNPLKVIGFVAGFLMTYTDVQRPDEGVSEMVCEEIIRVRDKSSFRKYDQQNEDDDFCRLDITCLYFTKCESALPLFHSCANRTKVP